MGSGYETTPYLVSYPDPAGMGSGYETTPYLEQQLVLGDALDGLDEVGVEGEDEAQFQLDALWGRARHMTLKRDVILTS